MTAKLQTLQPINAPRRISDDWGSGEWQAPRGVDKDGNPRVHSGIDFVLSLR